MPPNALSVLAASRSAVMEVPGADTGAVAMVATLAVSGEESDVTAPGAVTMAAADTSSELVSSSPWRRRRLRERASAPSPCPASSPSEAASAAAVSISASSPSASSSPRPRPRRPRRAFCARVRGAAAAAAAAKLAPAAETPLVGPATFAASAYPLGGPESPGEPATAPGGMAASGDDDGTGVWPNRSIIAAIMACMSPSMRIWLASCVP
mmetsp:Transcript_27169/g.87328  ORF Transcript_27169/g.87328 Transcript_27169/m.87328 type:complete len:210 (+) Transcript_27169:305-934(+)